MADLGDEIHKEFNTLRGRLAGLIESWGLPDRQERGMVGTMKALTYDGEDKVRQATGLPPARRPKD